MSRTRWGLVIFAAFLTVLSCVAQTPPAAPAQPQASASSPTPEQEQLLKPTEAFVRKLFAWGPDFNVKLGPLAPSVTPGFYVVPLQVTFNGQTDSGEVYVSKDGKTLLRGEMYDMSADPFAATRAKLHIAGSPSRGPVDARVTLVEFADFECPHCRELHEQMKTIEKQFPQVRLVYKDYPITQIHPWAETAAIGAHCAYVQSPEAFWKVHDALFEHQDFISTENIWDKLVGYASDAGLNMDAFKACLSSPEAAKAVDASRQEGIALGVNSTPTVFVNGRPVPGGDVSTLEQYINFELASHPK